MATTPEESEFTSAFDRIRARWQEMQEELGVSELGVSELGVSELGVSERRRLPDSDSPDAWLATIFLAFLAPGSELCAPAPAPVDRRGSSTDDASVQSGLGLVDPVDPVQRERVAADADLLASQNGR